MRKVTHTVESRGHFIVTIEGYEIPLNIGETVQDDAGNRFVLDGFSMDGPAKDASLLLKPMNGINKISEFLLMG